MKDIYELLKDVAEDIDGYDRLELSDLEKKRIYKHIRKNRGKNLNRRKRMAVAVAVLCIVSAMVPVSAGMLAHINGNIKRNYKEDINESLAFKTENGDISEKRGQTQGTGEDTAEKEQDAVDIKVLSVARTGSDINITCEFILEEGCDEFLEDCQKFALSHDNTFLAEAFKNSDILYDGQTMNTDYGGETGVHGILASYEDNKVVQIFNIHEFTEDAWKEDHQIILCFENLVIGDKLIEGKWEYVCDVNASDYEDTELVTYPIDVQGYATLPYEEGGCDRSIILDSYALTANGIVFYGTHTNIGYSSDEMYAKWREEVSEQGNTLRLYLKDNLGNEYLMYGHCLETEEEQDEKMGISTITGDFISEEAELAAQDQEFGYRTEYVLYEGAARVDEPDKNYLVEWDQDATEVTVVVQEEINIWEYHGAVPETTYQNVSEPVTISLVGIKD